jgi:hypothetical protein
VAFLKGKARSRLCPRSPDRSGRGRPPNRYMVVCMYGDIGQVMIEQQRARAGRNLIAKNLRSAVLLIPLVLICDVATFALCFWWYDLGLGLSSFMATLAPILLLLAILILMRVRSSGTGTKE